MADYGFFNAKNLDRTYTAEDFSGYLSHLICNGILDTYGDCFAMTADGLTVQIGTGRAWIDGHYFLNSSSETLDLSQFVDKSLSRYVIIGISCDTSEDARLCQFETLSGTPANSPEIPEFEDTENKTYLTLAAVYLEAAADTITDSNITDYRSDESKCGYVRCILGKCKVTEMLTQISALQAIVDTLTSEIDTAIANIDNLSAAVAELQDTTDKLDNLVMYMAADIAEAGQCGDNVYYAIYGDGTVILRGTGATYNYGGTGSDTSPFCANTDLTSVAISENITKLGNYLFYAAGNITELSFPATDLAIGAYTFAYTGIINLSIPENVTFTSGSCAFLECDNLQSAYYASPVLTSRTFIQCPALTDFTLTATCASIEKWAFLGCEALTALKFEGNLDQWAEITKADGWDADSAGAHGNLKKIQCTDGYLQWDSEEQEWAEVTENA